MRFAVFIFALVVRIGAIEWTGAETIKFGDGADYVATARSLCERGIYPERGNLPFFRAPGLPFFIAAATACEPSRTRAIKYGLAFCDALSVLLIFLIAQRLHASAKAPWIAAAMAALHPFFVGAVTDVRGEPLFMFLLVAAMWLLRRGSHALSGVALGLAALTRPTGLLCIPLFAVAAKKRAPIVLLSALLTLSPWVVRNYVRFGELIVVNDAAGFNLWRGTHRELLSIVETYDRAEFARRSWEFETEVVSKAAQEVDTRATTPAARDREWRRMAVENVRRDPWFAIQAMLKRMAMYWRPWLHPAEHGWKAIAISVMVNLALLVFGVAGLWRYPDRRLAAAVGVFFIAMWMAHLPYVPTMRLRSPLTDPLLIVFAAGWRRQDAGGPVTWKAALVVVLLFFATVPSVGSAIAVFQSAAGEWWAMPLFALLYVIFAVFLLPVGLLSAAAAVMWGWKAGGAIELVTCTGAALFPYFVGRRGFSEWIQRRIPQTGVALDSPFILLLLRIVPVVPYVVLNYVAGATRVRTRDFIVTTFLGSIPSVFLFAYFVDTMAAGARGAATQAKILGACALVAAAAIILRWAARRVVRRAST